MTLRVERGKGPKDRYAMLPSFPTHPLEQPVDIRVIQVLLGHRYLETTTL